MSKTKKTQFIKHSFWYYGSRRQTQTQEKSDISCWSRQTDMWVKFRTYLGNWKDGLSWERFSKKLESQSALNWIQVTKKTLQNAIRRKPSRRTETWFRFGLISNFLVCIDLSWTGFQSKPNLNTFKPSHDFYGWESLNWHIFISNGFNYF